MEARAALEQAQLEQRLELRDLRREARLRDVTGAGGAVEAAVVGDRDGVLELAQGGSHAGQDATRARAAHPSDYIQ